MTMQFLAAEGHDGTAVAERNRMSDWQDAGWLPWPRARSQVDLEPALRFLVAKQSCDLWKKGQKQDHRWRPQPRKRYENGSVVN